MSLTTEDLERKLVDLARIQILPNQLHQYLKKRSQHLVVGPHSVVVDLHSAVVTRWEPKLLQRYQIQLSAISQWLVDQDKEMINLSNQ